MTELGSPETRVRALVAAARRIADRGDPLGIEARRDLPKATGLSPEGVEIGLSRCLETNPSDSEIAALVASAPSAPRAHVLLSANVFVAAHRAIAIALAASADVIVRPSRREPVVARLLERATHGLFRTADHLVPRPGDHLWAYGSDETLDAVRRDLPDGAVLHAHGAGVGIVVVELEGEEIRERALAEAIAEDVVAFDQRGCSSPRLVFVLAEARAVRRFAEQLAAALARAARRTPIGTLGADEIGDVARYRDALLVAGELIPAGPGYVGLDLEGHAAVVPPIGRNVHVARSTDLGPVARALRKIVTAVGIHGSPALASTASSLFPDARIASPGAMQTPPFDGPVDRRRVSRSTTVE